jgi:hypothetical protein
MMRRGLYVGAAIGLVGCIMGGLAWQYDAAMVLRGIIPSAEARPEDGKVANGNYRNDYFGLSYRLPSGWSVAEAGPDPSQSAYYVLTTFIPDGEPNATILVAAQDMFFAGDETGSLADQARELQRAVSTIAGMTIDREAEEMKVADRPFYRVDYNGVGLYRATITTEIRCHVFSFNVTARDPELLNRLIHTLESDLSFVPTGDAALAPLPCAKDYAAGDNVLQRVSPLPVGPKFVPIPVRIIVGADGSVKHVHVIRATDDQRRSIEDALYRWKLKPYMVAGHASAVETGLLFTFKENN